MSRGLLQNTGFCHHKHSWRGLNFPGIISGFGRPISKFDDTVDECGIMGEHRITDFSVIV